MVAVHKNAEEEVHDIDEDVGAQDSLPEIPWVSHLGEEGDEEHGTAIRVHGLVETIQGADKAGTARGSSIWRGARVGVDRTRTEAWAEGCFCCCIIGRGVG